MIRQRLALLVVIVFAAACGALRAGTTTTVVTTGAERSADIHPRFDQDASYAIYPTQHLPLRFDHAQHLRLPGVTCEGCHDNATASTSAGDRLVPGERTCTPCHDVHRDEPLRAGSPAARCDACHVGFDLAQPLRVARVQIPAANLRFSHRGHLERGLRCESCHGSMRGVGLATRLELPTMQSCLACHRERGSASAACTVCHFSQPDGTLRTQFAEGWLNPPEWMTGLHHDADFWVNHRLVAADDGARCATCHRESDCTDCHDGRVRDRRTHPNDYVNIHPAEARQSAEHCTSCHRTSSFCEACHQRMGVAQSSPALAAGTGRFHPPPEVWSGASVTPQHHAIEARRSLTVCVSCHTERDCVTCHASVGLGGGGISPHPPGWLDRCGALMRASSRPCAQCHDDLGAIATRCR